jgi:hypothetical protein
MGALGSRTAADELGTRGHRIVELERGCTSNKLWTKKIKRIRVPDLLCARCGLHFEVRAKSTLEVRMSHAPSNPERSWDAGMRDSDVCIFLLYRDGPPPTVSRILNAFTVGELRAHRSCAKLGQMKSAAEGSESDLTWPTWVPTGSGMIESVESTKAKLRGVNGRRQTYPLNRSGVTKRLYVQPGESYIGEEQILAGPMVCASLNCTPGYLPSFAGLGVSDLYCAVKSLRAREDAAKFADQLAALREHADERLKLEVLGQLARLGDEPARASLIARALSGDGEDAPWAMEATFILSELGGVAIPALAQIRDHAAYAEARCGAVWGLLSARAGLDVVLPTLGHADDNLAVHTLIACSRLVTADNCRVLLNLVGTPGREAAAAYHALALSEAVPVGAVIAFLRQQANPDSQAARYALSILGRKGRAAVTAAPAWNALPVALRDRLEWRWFERDGDWLTRGDAAARLTLLAQQM